MRVKIVPFFLFLTTFSGGVKAQIFEHDSLTFHSSAKTDLVVRKVKVAESVGGGGGLFLDGGRLYHMSADGRLIVYIVDSKGLKGVDTDSAPNLEINRNNFKKLSAYKSMENVPRTHGVHKWNDRLFVSYDYMDLDTKKIRFGVSVLDSGSWRRIIASPDVDSDYYSTQAGGAFTSSKDYLFVSVGNQSLDRRNGLVTDFAAQNPNMIFGKILKVDKKHKISIFSSGHRNNQGLVFSNNGMLLATEHGPRGGDKLIRISEGDNHGWPFENEGSAYGRWWEYKPYRRHQAKTRLTDKNKNKINLYGCNGNGPTADCDFSGIEYREPMFNWIPSIAPSDLIKLNHQDVWEDDYLVASLKSMSLYRLNIRNNSIYYVERINLGNRIRSLVEGDNGIIYALSGDGSILEIHLRRGQRPGDRSILLEFQK